MFLTAHRIQNKNNLEQEADHYFYYKHPDDRLIITESNEFDCGFLEKQQTKNIFNIETGKNPIISYIDILCSNTTPSSLIRTTYMELIRDKGFSEIEKGCRYTDIDPWVSGGLPRVPWSVTAGNDLVWFRISACNISPGKYWFVEGPRLLKGLLSWYDNE